jgi:hypothetical protein
MDMGKLLTCLILILFLCNACSPQEINRFVPDEESLFKITFEYPTDWKFTIGRDEKYESLLAIIRSDYMWLLKNSLYISVSVDRAELPPARESIQESLNAIRGVPERRGKGFKTLSERELTIGGMESFEIVSWIAEYQGRFPGLNKIWRTIFILDEDRFYKIDIIMYEADVGKDFSQEVDCLLESIERVP